MAKYHKDLGIPNDVKNKVFDFINRLGKLSLSYHAYSFVMVN